MIGTKPGADYLERVGTFYAMLDLTTLSAALDDGAIYNVPDSELVKYATVAAVRWHGGPIVVDGTPDPNEELRGWFAYALTAIMSGEGLTLDDDGEAWITGMGGEPFQLTQSNTQHIEWMVELLTWRSVADQFLEAVPAEVRGAARAQADATWMTAFQELVGGA